MLELRWLYSMNGEYIWFLALLVEHGWSFLQFRMSNFVGHLGLKLSLRKVILGYLRKPSARLEQTSDDCAFHQLALSSDAEKSMPNGSKWDRIRIRLRSDPWCSFWKYVKILWKALAMLDLFTAAAFAVKSFASVGYPSNKKPAVMKLQLQYDRTWWNYIYVFQEHVQKRFSWLLDPPCLLLKAEKKLHNAAESESKCDWGTYNGSCSQQYTSGAKWSKGL